MTTSDNIKWAQRQYENHCAQHACKIGECDERRELWLSAMKVAEQWGRD